MGQVRRPCVILLGLEKNPDSGTASSWWEGKEDLTRPGVVTSTGTSQLPSRGGRGCDWTRPGGYSYRYCSASPRLTGNSVLSSPLNFSETVLQFSSRTRVLFRNFSEFSDHSSNFSKNCSKTQLFNFWTGTA